MNLQYGVDSKDGDQSNGGVGYFACDQYHISVLIIQQK